MRKFIDPEKKARKKAWKKAGRKLYEDLGYPVSSVKVGPFFNFINVYFKDDKGPRNLPYVKLNPRTLKLKGLIK